MEINPFKIIKKLDIKKSAKEHNQDILSDLTSKIRINYRGKTYLLEIKDIDNTYITFIIPENLKYVIGIRNNDILKTSIISVNGLYTTNIRIINKQLVNDDFFCSAELNAKLNKVQRRKHPRVSVNFPVNCSFLHGEMFESVAKDISVGGMLLNASKDVSLECFYDDQDIELVFEIEDTLIRTKATVISAKESPLRDSYVYHLEFKEIKEEYREVIGKFVRKHMEYNTRSFKNRR